MSIVLNEREFALNALGSFELGSKPSETITRVAKYYFSEGYKKSAIEKKIDEFLLKCDPDIVLTNWQKVIDTSIKYAKKYSLIEIDSIPITKKELDICSSVNSRQLRRLLFTLICCAKYYNAVNDNNNGWVNCADKDLFSMANIVRSVTQQSLMINDLKELGLIKFSKRVDNIKINVTCLDYDDAPELEITNFTNLGYQYMRYCGEPYFICEICGVTTRRNSNAQKYCHKCYLDMKRESSRNSMSLLRSGV